jgi:hypothetical protein
MYQISVDFPAELERKVFISPDPYVVGDFIKDRLTELQHQSGFEIRITTTPMQYLGEYEE